MYVLPLETLKAINRSKLEGFYKTLFIENTVFVILMVSMKHCESLSLLIKSTFIILSPALSTPFEEVDEAE